jgi:trk system potassium uptake protein TrkH
VLASLSRARRVVRRAFAISPARLCSALVLTMALDFAVLKEAHLQLPLTALQAFLFAVSVAMGLRRDRELSPQHAVRRYVYHGLVATVALIALSEKWWIATHVEPALRAGYASSYRIEGATITLCGVAAALGRGQRFLRFFAAFAEHPARQMALSFLLLAIFGGFLLTLPICVRDPSRVSFVDALFMATSAVCVSGLTVHGLATTYTSVGQAIILALVQIGGLGIMVLSASMVILAGRKLRAKSSAVLAEILDSASVSSLRGSIMGILGFTFTIELLGALALYLAFARYPEMALPAHADRPMAGSGSLAWAALFHSVSAFCNAGFSLTRDNLEPFASSLSVSGIIMVLVMLGSIGFPVLSEVSSWCAERLAQRRPQRLSLHTRVVLAFSGVLTLAVAALLLALEWSHSLAHLSWPDRALAALFQSVVLRTAGFNTVSIADFSPAALALGCLVMFVGASPGSCGGGVKVTTLAVLFAAFRAELRGSPEPHLLDRRLSEATIRRAIAVAFVSALVLTLLVFVMLVVEPHEPLRLVFEVVGAFSTAGLNTNLTPMLSSTGKLLLALTMLIGRVGPLTLALAATQRVARAHYHRPQERVLIG